MIEKRLGVPVRFWKTARPIIGVVQIYGTIVTLGLLERYGNTRPTIIALAATLGLTAISLFLFGFLRVHDQGE